MNEATKAYLDAMEARLTGRITTLQDTMIERFRGVDAALRGIEIFLTTHTELMRSTNMLLTMIATKIHCCPVR